MTSHQWKRTPELDQAFLDLDNKPKITIIYKCTRCGLYLHTVSDSKNTILSNNPNLTMISAKISDDCDIQIISDVTEL
jgi:hypothetical protein